jgi:hypothetical protein
MSSGISFYQTTDQEALPQAGFRTHRQAIYRCGSVPGFDRLPLLVKVIIEFVAACHHTTALLNLSVAHGQKQE